MIRLGLPRVLALALALGLHAAIALALIAGASRENAAPEPSVEIEVVAAAPSELLETEPAEIAAAPEQAKEAQEVKEGAAATMLAQDAPDVSDEVDPDATATVESDNTTKDVVPDTDIAATAEAPDTASTEPPVEAAEIAPKDAEPLPLDRLVDEVDSVDEVDKVDEAAEAEHLAAAEPLVPAPDAPQIAVAKPPDMAAVPPEPVEVMEGKVKERPKPEPKRKVAKKAAPMVAGSKERKPATRQGKSVASRSGGVEAAASYRSVVLSRINARKSAIAARLSGGIAGTVLISFSIGPSGAVSRASIARSSGNAAIDAAARAAMAQTTFPPPPGGRFTATVPIRVN